MELAIQEVIALVIVAFAAVYLVQRLTGWPRLGKKPKSGVKLGTRLARGLKRR